MQNKRFGVLLVLTTLLIASPVFEAHAVLSHRAEALVLVNSESASHADFRRYIQPYLDNFGVPYTVLDIVTESVN